MDHAARVDRVRAALPGAGCDAVLVTKLVNIRYLTGFSGSAARLLVTADDLLFVSDSRYAAQSSRQLAAAGVDARIEIATEADDQRRLLVDGVAAARGVAKLGLEADHVTWAAQRRYGTDDWFAGTELVATEALVDALRMVKDDGEVARIAAAAGIADDALARVRPRLIEGPTEAEVAIELESEMRRLGADGPSFDTIVASGANGAMPHYRAGRRRLGEGDLVVLDFGAVVDGYCSDMTRTVMLGEPSPTQRRMFDVVLAAQQAGVDAVADGVEAKDVDATCRDRIAEAGWADAFGHGTGHGVGLEIHEAPRVGRTSTATLATGHVVTVEPGVYLRDHGGVRIEDTVVVTASGCRPVTLAPKDPSLP